MSKRRNKFHAPNDFNQTQIPSRAESSRQYCSSTLEHILARESPFPLDVSMLKEPLPAPSTSTSIDASKPTKFFQRMLDIIAVVFRSKRSGHTGVAEFRDQFPDLCKWMSFFIRTWALPSMATATTAGLEFQHRVIHLSGAAADEVLFVSEMKPLFPGVGGLIPPFVELLIELSVCLASTFHPCFSRIWSRLMKLNSSILDREISSYISTARYDLPRILMDILLQEVDRPDMDMDISVVSCTLNLMENSMRCSPDSDPESYLHRFLREGIVTKLTTLLHRVATVEVHSTDYSYRYIGPLVFRDCCRCLARCMEDGFTWACEALDSGVVSALGYTLVQLGLLRGGTGISLSVGDQEEIRIRNACSAVLRTLTAFLVIPSIIRRAHSKAKLLQKDQTLQDKFRRLPESEGQFVKEYVDMWRERTEVVARKTLDWFNVSSEIRMCCSNDENCPYRSLRPTESKPKYYRCARCRVAVYCSAQCQRKHWIKRHRTECHSLRPRPGHSFRASKLDESFIRYNTNIEIIYRKDMLKRGLLSPLNSAGGPTVHQFDYNCFTAENGVYGAIDFRRLVRDLEANGESTVKDELVAERKKLDVKRELLTLIRYPGEKAISWLVYRPNLDYVLSSDSRLLNNLISHEKEYSKHLHALLDSSHASFNSLTAFAASSPPPTSQIILAVAGSLSNVDDALRGYVVAVERWRQYLADLKDLEDEVGNIMRDRDILVTRLLKASKSKPTSNRDSLLSSIQMSPSPQPMPPFHHSPSSSTLGSYDDPTSMTYLPTPPEPTNSYFSAPPNKKLQAAQSELQACEAHLAIKERELDVKRNGAITEGLHTRFHALSECGQRWTQIGKDVEVYLYGQTAEEQRAIASASPRPIFPTAASDSKPLPPPLPSPNLDPNPPVIHTPIPIPIRPAALPEPEGPSSDISHSSIAPSQSASQVGTLVPSTPTSTTFTVTPNQNQNHIYADLEAQPVNASSSSLFMPKRHVLPHRITEEDLDVRAARERQSLEEQGGGSSEEDEGEHDEPMEVIENPRYNPNQHQHQRNGGGGSHLHDASSTSSSPRKEKSRFLGSIRGLFSRHGKEGSTTSSVAGSRGDEDDEVSVGRGRRRKKARKPLFAKEKKWETRIEGNIRELTRDSPALTARPFPGRRASEDMVFGSGTVTPRPRVFSDVSPNASPKVAGKRLKKKTQGQGQNKGEHSGSGGETATEATKKKRRRSASLDPALLNLREENAANGVDSGSGTRDERIGEWVDSQKKTTTAGVDEPPKRKTSVKRRKSVKDASASTPNLAPAPTLLHQAASSKEEDIYLVPVTSEGTLSRSSSNVSARNRGQTTTTAASGTGGGLQRSGSGKSKRRSASVDQPAHTQPRTLHTTGAPSLPATTPTPTTPTTPTPRAQKRASSPVTFGGGVGMGSSSLMSIVEDVAKANREAWNGPPAHGSPVMVKSIGGTVKPAGLVDVPMEVVKAPKSVSVKDLEAMDTDSVKAKAKSGASANAGMFLPKAPSLKVEEGGHGRAGQGVPPSHPHPSSHPVASASTSTLTPAVPSSSASLPTPAPARHDHVHFQRAPSPPSQPRKQVMPLKSALKGGSGSGGSRTPSPGTVATYGSTPSPPPNAQLQPPQQHNIHHEPSIGLFPLPTGPSSQTQTQAQKAPIPMVNGNAIQPSPNGNKHDSDDDDAASISSYETGHEVFVDVGGDGDSSGGETERENQPLPPPPPPPPAKINGNGNAIVPESAPQPQPVPQRRKSVRVSLKPQFSPTPPAIEDDPEGMVWEVTESPTSTETPRQRQSSQKGRGYREERDMWDDSSEDEEDNEYASARRLLNRLGRKEKEKTK
ncbi:hypothetical protein V5O48_010024 [Marasmius crinis-equi]|uniref:MYND-type domain-containing protein n=1 Tax=Marasmius crinis-equi TaxID=585013 RepID=A0ABR3F9I4_9AGAR